LEWAGHVWRAEGSLIKEVTENRLTGKTSIIGQTWPRCSVYDTIVKYLKKTKELLDTGQAFDRESRWKSIIDMVMVLN